MSGPSEGAGRGWRSSWREARQPLTRQPSDSVTLRGRGSVGSVLVSLGQGAGLRLQLRGDRRNCFWCPRWGGPSRRGRGQALEPHCHSVGGPTSRAFSEGGWLSGRGVRGPGLRPQHRNHHKTLVSLITRKYPEDRTQALEVRKWWLVGGGTYLGHWGLRGSGLGPTVAPRPGARAKVTCFC